MNAANASWETKRNCLEAPEVSLGRETDHPGETTARERERVDRPSRHKPVWCPRCCQSIVKNKEIEKMQ